MHLIVIVPMIIVFMLMGLLKLAHDTIEFIFDLPLKVVFALLILIALFVYTQGVNAETFKYKGNIEIKAKDYNTASKLCFNKLTNGRYPGEEKGLEIIDICTNPIKGRIK